MAENKFAMDYIDVATRIAEFREKYPNGALQPADASVPYRIETIGDQVYIAVVAAAYRTPDDPRPGIGMAYEQFPGRTPYTRGSELQNAETSAWGRAIVAALVSDTKKGIASAEEVRNRQAERDSKEATVKIADPEQAQALNMIGALCDTLGVERTKAAALFKQHKNKEIKQGTTEELNKFASWLQEQDWADKSQPVAA
ncbi:MAG: hypothetical protein ACREQ5_00710 [Candidatus Dormibacteria bacterium]